MRGKGEKKKSKRKKERKKEVRKRNNEGEDRERRREEGSRDEKGNVILRGLTTAVICLDARDVEIGQPAATPC